MILNGEVAKTTIDADEVNIHFANAAFSDEFGDRIDDDSPMVDRPSANGDGKASGPKPKKERFPLVSCKALDGGDYTVRALITDVLYAGVVAIVGGLFKTCKSLVGMDVAISLATGRPFLNSFTVPEPVTVVYFAGEGGPSVTQEYGRRIAASKGLSLGDVSNLFWVFSVPRLADLRDLDEFAQVIDDTGAEVAVVDNLMLSMPGDNAGNVMVMGQILGNVIRICNERNVTPVFIHHFKRTRQGTDPYAPGELLDLTQAGAAEIAGQWLLLTKREAYNPDNPGEHELYLNIGGRLGNGCLHALDIHEGRLSDPGGRRWEVEVLRPSEVRKAADSQQAEAKVKRAADKQQASVGADAKRIVEVMVKLPAGDTGTEIRERAGMSGARFKLAIASLLETGDVLPADIIKPNRKTPYPGYRLPSQGTLTLDDLLKGSDGDTHE